MDSSICVAVITGFPRSSALAMIRFCTSGTSSGPISTPRSPRATMTASASASTSSSASTASDFSIFAGGRAFLRDELFEIADVRCRPHERERDEVAAELQRELEVLEILARERRDRDRDTWEIHALVRRHRPTDDDAAASAAGLDLLDAQPDHPVGDEHLMAPLQDLTDCGRRDRQLAVTSSFPGDDGNLAPPQQVERLVERADSELRPLEVADQRERSADLLLDVTDELGPRGMIFMSPV